MTMNKWQKIIGVVVILALIVANVWAVMDYIHLADTAGAWCAEITQKSFFDCIFSFRQHFWFYTFLSIIDLVIIIVLFICLWRKGGKQ